MLTTASVRPLTFLYVTEMNRTPEYRLAMGALSGLRQDLFHDAFAYRPLPRRRTDGPLTRRLPGRIRDAAAWMPHAAVGAVAMFTLLLAYGGEGVGPALVLTGFIPAAAVVMTLLRPVGAWWLSLASTPLGVTAGFEGDWPWSPSGFVAHLAVMTLVALRTRPRTAAWMWLLTAGYGLFAGVMLSSGSSSNIPEMLFVAALVLLVVTVWHVRREAKEEVAAQQTVTAVERDRRTLLEERTTIARELHDVVAHHMSVVAIQAEAAPYRVENPPEELARAFEVIRENAVAALAELRRILGVVRAEDYEAPDAPQPVLADIENLLSNVRDAGLEADKTVTGAVRLLPQGVELSAYRIIQEALSNALRHAPGSTARVEISYVLGGLGLRIVNTAPQGLVKPSPGAGHGITGMRERVTMLGGEMTAQPTQEGGYEVTAFIPVAAAETASEETS
ncbi:signal transduction histidine kinase [Streptomyces sp. SLBN-118]|uniref:sensor histidine kinase n=1 Tax=Streptomyces sp. SLBN-118 TaxID=2768454 RepID=UPI0011504AE0|nr:histidine kinase [Streptomyces sp. SLBN-118]TQK52859.1 signal transduction histidine kinase [Streptomyces sp. SLBN-118]